MSTLVELPKLPVAASSGLDPGERDRLIARAKALSWLSLAWMTVEGAVGIIAALMAGSVALLGFGIDSAIEGVASVIVIWRFTGTRRLSEAAERRAQKAVGVSFFLLAPGRDPRADRRRAPGDELGRNRTVGGLDRCDANAWRCQATHR